MAEKLKEKGPKQELIEGLKSKVTASFTATVLFKDSPLRDKWLETTVLRLFALEALEKGKKLDDVRIYGAKTPDGRTWADFLKSCSEHGRANISSNLLLDGAALKLSKELAEFMRTRIKVSDISGV